MVCRVFSSSEYIEGCDIFKYGEGCERCVPLEWKIPLFAFLICLGFIIFVILYLKRLNKKHLKKGDKK